mgnify:CR=1 FL=1
MLQKQHLSRLSGHLSIIFDLLTSPPLPPKFEKNKKSLFYNLIVRSGVRNQS